MIFYKVLHSYKLNSKSEKKHIGIFSTLQNAEAAIEGLKDKKGFIDTPQYFKILKCFRFKTPRLIDRIFWIDGFETYSY